MPDKKEKKLANPSPKFEDELARHWASAQINMPKEAGKTRRVQPMGSIMKHLPGFKDAYGYASPSGVISINPNHTMEDNMIRDTLVHELTHMGQPRRGIGQYFKDKVTPYDQIPVEKEALEAERSYPWKEKGRDIKLKYPDPGKRK